MRLIKYEFYKIASSKFIYVVFLGGTLIYAYITRAYYMQDGADFLEHIIDFPYHFGSLFIGALVLISLSSVFSEEYEQNTNSLIFTTRCGRRKISAAKIISSIIFVLITVLAAYAVDYTVNINQRIMPKFDIPINSLKSYLNCQYRFGVMQYFFVELIVTLFGTAAFSIFILYLSSKIRNTLTAFVIGSSVFGISYIVHDSNYFSLEWILKNVSYSDIMRVKNLFNRPRIYKFGILCASHAALICTFTAVVSIILTVLILVRSNVRDL